MSVLAPGISRSSYEKGSDGGGISAGLRYTLESTLFDRGLVSHSDTSIAWLPPGSREEVK
jgi:coenzyme F420-reducing hydrogenase beta subunit